MHRVLLVVLALAAARAADAQTRAAASAPVSPFPVGERLFYEVVYGPFRLGTAEMKVEGIDTVRGKPAVHVRLRIQGRNYLYAMDNTMQSWISLADTSSLRFRNDRNEKGKKSNDHYEIFPDSGYYRQVDEDSLKDVHKPTSKQPLDDMSFFYFLRTTPLVPGQRYEFQRYFRPDRNPVILDSLTLDTLDVPAGRFPSIRLMPLIPEGRGILADAADAKLWLSNDERRIVVQLKTKIQVIGYLTLRLVKFEPGAS